MILGSEELEQEKCVVKNLKNGEQIEIPLVDLENIVITMVNSISNQVNESLVYLKKTTQNLLEAQEKDIKDKL